MMLDRTTEKDEVGEMLEIIWPLAGKLQARSLSTEELDKMIDKHTDKISEITLAMSLVWNRVIGRSRA